MAGAVGDEALGPKLKPGGSPLSTRTVPLLPDFPQLGRCLACDRHGSIDSYRPMVVDVTGFEDHRGPRGALEVAQPSSGDGRKPERRAKNRKGDWARHRMTSRVGRRKHAVSALLEKNTQLCCVHRRLTRPRARQTWTGAGVAVLLHTSERIHIHHCILPHHRKQCCTRAARGSRRPADDSAGCPLERVRRTIASSISPPNSVRLLRRRRDDASRRARTSARPRTRSCRYSIGPALNGGIGLEVPRELGASDAPGLVAASQVDPAIGATNLADAAAAPTGRR